MIDTLELKRLIDQEAYESSVDFAQEDLPKDIWDKNTDGNYKIKSDIEGKIRQALKAYKDVDLEDIAQSIHIVGSLGTNQWTKDADLDVHIIPDLEKISDPEALQRSIKKWYRENAESVGGHKIEVYLQLNPAQEMVGDALYELGTHTWLKGPTTVPQDFNPYDEFKGILDTIDSVVGETDKVMGELKRDVIDYDTIKQAISKMPKETKEKLKVSLEAKLQEIEASIEELMKHKKEWLERRKQSSVPTTPNQALDDLEYIKKWKDENATFKFLNRYDYLRLITDMEEMLKSDGGIDPQEVDKIKDMLGVMNSGGVDNG
jgi:hypothetical protein